MTPLAAAKLGDGGAVGGAPPMTPLAAAKLGDAGAVGSGVPRTVDGEHKYCGNTADPAPL